MFGHFRSHVLGRVDKSSHGSSLFLPSLQPPAINLRDGDGDDETHDSDDNDSIVNKARYEHTTIINGSSIEG